MKRLACLALALILAMSICALASADTETAYEGVVLAAVNTLHSSSAKTEGYFTAPDENALFSLEGSENGESCGVYDIYTDEETGKVYTILDPDLPELSPLPQSGALLKNTVGEGNEYSVSSSFTLTESDWSTQNSMVCLYVGTYCTVWGSVSDDEAIQLNEENAVRVGEAFDKDFIKMTEIFGSYWYDADSDGKVAIMCYDLDHEYGYSDPSSYTAGYFWMVDMISPTGHVNGVNYGKNNYINGIDCIHIDTYPTMGQEHDLFGRVEDSYSTLFHEFQHMLNYSNNVKDGDDGLIDSMETHLNEAFSMAAQHYVYGADETKGRITHFNSSYSPGTSLTYWGGSLSNYSNSYLFGQYLRTRYGQLTNTDGWGVYSKILSLRSPTNSDTLAIITELLDTTPEKLILDFWNAVYKKDPHGAHGFAGEEWAEYISPKISSSFSNTGGIYPGGAKFYLLNGAFVPKDSSNISFLAFDDITLPKVMDVKARRISASEGKFCITSNKSGILHYASTPMSVQSPASFARYSITAGNEFVMTLSGRNPYNEYKIFYYLEDEHENTTKTQCIILPAWLYMITVNESDGGSLTLTSDGSTVASGSYVTIGSTVTVDCQPDEGKELKAIYLDGEKLEGNTFTVSGAHTVSARFGKKDIPAASSFAAGDGSEDSPFIISTPAELKYFAQRVNSGDAMQGQHIALGADLALDSLELEPIGESTPFSGSFDGAGHTISGLFKDSDAACTGLFGNLEGSVENLVIKDAILIVKTGEGSAGIIAGQNHGLIKNCVIEGGSITSNCTERAYTGAVAGQNLGTISACSAVTYIDTQGEGWGYTGGITGSNEGIISDCFVNTDIYADHSAVTYAGGVAGYASGSINGCYVWQINITATAPESAHAAGIAAYANYGDIADCIVNAKTIKVFTLDAMYASIDQIAAYNMDSDIERCFYSAAAILTVNTNPADSELLGKEASASELCSKEFLKANTTLNFDSCWETLTHPEYLSPTLQVMRTLLGQKITISPCPGGVVSADYDIAYIGQKVTLEAQGADCFAFSHFTLDGQKLPSNSFTVTGAHTVGAEFTLNHPGAIDGGITGDVTWIVTEANELLFVGEGATQNYESAADRPWHRYAAQITALTLDPGVTHLGDYAAAQCTALSGVSLSEGLLSVGSGVFEGSAVSDIILPSTISAIGKVYTPSLKNVFYAGSSENWASVETQNDLSSVLRIGLPAAIKGTAMLDAYPMDGIVEAGKFVAIMADGSCFDLGGSARLGEYDFSSAGSAVIPITFLGYEYEHTVTVYKDRHADIKTEGSSLTVTFYGKDVQLAVAAIYCDGQMVAIRCIQVPANGSALTLDLPEGKNCTAKVFLLGQANAPLEGHREAAFPAAR